MRCRGRQGGMTLVELMVVVTIIAIIAAIAVTLYQDAQKRARMAADEGVIASMNSAISMYYGKHNGSFPASPGVYVVPSPPAFQCAPAGFEYSYDGNGLITITVRDVSRC